MGEIYTSSSSCFKFFGQIRATLAQESISTDVSHFPPSELEEQHGRFKVWLGNLGALQQGHGSLDYRLRESSVMQGAVLKLLEQLNEQLIESLEVVSGTRLPYELQEKPEFLSDEESDYDSDEEEDPVQSVDALPRSELRQRLKSITEIISGLYELSFKIRNSTSRHPSVKANLYRDIDKETDVDVFSVYSGYDNLHVLDLMRSLRSPKALEVSKDNFLTCRLGKGITTRRRRMRYWQMHSKKLAVGHTQTQVEEASQHVEQATRLFTRQGEDVLGVEARRERFRFGLTPSVMSRSIFSGTEATKYDKNLDDLLETQSVVSYTSTVFDSESVGLSLPPPPSTKSGETGFLCPYCGLLCAPKHLTPHGWRSHLLHDLQPYLCTYPDCKDADVMYSSRRLWLEHEGSAHRPIWRCFQHKKATFNARAKYEHHLRTAHSESLETDETRLSALLDLGKTYSVDDRDECPICLSTIESIEEFQRHLARHLELMAVFALPRGVTDDGTESQIGSDAPQARTQDSKSSTDSGPLDFTDGSPGDRDEDPLTWARDTADDGQNVEGTEQPHLGSASLDEVFALYEPPAEYFVDKKVQSIVDEARRAFYARTGLERYRPHDLRDEAQVEINRGKLEKIPRESFVALSLDVQNEGRRREAQEPKGSDNLLIRDVSTMSTRDISRMKLSQLLEQDFSVLAAAVLCELEMTLAHHGEKTEKPPREKPLRSRDESWSCAAIAGIHATFHASLDHSVDVCGYCGKEFPNPPNWGDRAGHLNYVHKFSECNQAKKFYRADHFRQHLKHTHRATFGTWTDHLEKSCWKDQSVTVGWRTESPEDQEDDRETSACLKGDEQLSHDTHTRSEKVGFSTTTLKYTKGQLISMGAFTQLHLALKQNGELFVVKEFTLKKASSNGKYDLRTEIDKYVGLMSRMKHSNIVSFLGSDTDGSEIKVFLEYMAGGSLRSMTRTYGRLNETLAASFIRQALAALAYLHKQSIIHRDVKADNILLDNKGLCKLNMSIISIDARALDGPITDMKGTVSWMAPEVIRLSQESQLGIDSKVDIWSLGCTLLELLSGRRPWSEEEADGAIYKLGSLNEAPPIPDDVSLSPLAGRFLATCLTTDPSRRPTSDALLLHSFLAPKPESDLQKSGLQDRIRQVIEGQTKEGSKDPEDGIATDVDLEEKKRLPRESRERPRAVITNLAPEVPLKDVREFLLENLGGLDGIGLIEDKGNVILEFEASESLHAALALHGLPFGRRTFHIRVVPATSSQILEHGGSKHRGSSNETPSVKPDDVSPSVHGPNRDGQLPATDDEAEQSLDKIRPRRSKSVGHGQSPDEILWDPEFNPWAAEEDNDSDIEKEETQVHFHPAIAPKQPSDDDSEEVSFAKSMGPVRPKPDTGPDESFPAGHYKPLR